MIVTIDNAEHYTWGAANDGWHLLKSKGLSVIMERMNPGVSEVMHCHQNSQQVFFILSGIADFEMDGKVEKLMANQSIRVSPKKLHRISNSHLEDLRFILVSEPSVHRDRIEILDYTSEQSEYLKTLNLEWLEKYFSIEPNDSVQLSTKNTQMKNLLLLIPVCCMTVSLSFGQTYTDWSKFKWLMGEWAGEGSGKPGEGKGSFSLKEDLGGKILVRKNYTEYPATKDRPATIHNDLMVVYTDFSGTPSKAIYFDNEGHTINYTFHATEKSIVFISEKIPHVPVFRLTYEMIDATTLNIRFEMSEDGNTFMIYTAGKCIRK